MIQKPVATSNLVDNHYGDYAAFLLSQSITQIDLLKKYSNLKLSDFEKLGVEVCTNKIDDAGSDEAGTKEAVFAFRQENSKNYIDTWNCMGVLCFRDQASGESVLVQIRSRFDTGEGQPFLVYLLSKVFGGSFFNEMQIPSKPEEIWELLLALMFRKHLVDACEIGMFRQYRVNYHNDLRYRGKFDIDTNLKTNIPFLGNIAYITRDISFNNPLNHLIRHAMTRISKKWPGLLTDGAELTALKHLFEQNTPTWEPNAAHKCKLEKTNRIPVSHPFYASLYEPLRKLSLAILHDEGATPFDATESEVEGFIFDGAWLWEEYLNSILSKDGFKHPRNKTGTDPEYIFEPRERAIYPDFWKEGIVADAKYKKLASIIDMDDLCQIITYMHVLNCKNGYFIYPKEAENKTNANQFVGTLKGNGGEVGIIGFPIPEAQVSFKDYAELMRQSEDKVCHALDSIEKGVMCDA